ncbi:MAG: transposase [Betaproteobacteria bacterium]|nr:transposase [Betaproteobacteria bacterium]
MRYLRSDVSGGTYFFTLNLADRSSDLLVRHIGELRAAIAHVKDAHPFAVVAMVALPDRLHAIWRLPGDAAYPLRWSLVKAGFSRRLAKGERISASRESKRERGIWQRRYWEHKIRDETDLARHVDYIHYNPVKHGWVKRAIDWPHSALHGYIERKVVAPGWGGQLGDQAGAYGER